MDEWLTFCQHHSIELSPSDQRRAFHFMQYLSAKQKKKHSHGVDVDAFVSFLGHEYYNMFLDRFKHIIDTVKDKVAQTLSEIDDDYIFVYT
eukprot:CAMPEP_0202723260 /NCGR_PEP_ID=MMETSP1385-20130828/164456_1 /ASSEMBLY_ACC=CAM_ASM_000861 /TAXON_ID=933848 /ORGANISM="Elphidium margaritaceum" /LENGTH=90 /DNA_ID=CAMNT_0049388323 /DNA_START=47 /DNA_END=319 /DNA_ORIENTATION=-